MPKLAINKIEVRNRFRKSLGDIQSLATSIKEVGLLHPIVVRPDGRLIAGERRLAACKRLGWQSVPVTILDLKEVIRGEYAENAERRTSCLPKLARSRDGVLARKILDDGPSSSAARLSTEVVPWVNILGSNPPSTELQYPRESPDRYRGAEQIQAKTDLADPSFAPNPTWHAPDHGP
jgi:hypothetical protein